MKIVAEFMTIVIYSILGTILMMIGTFVVDLVIPCDFPTEIKKRNTAVGCVMAGTSIGIGIIVKAAVMSPAGTAIQESLLSGVVSTVYYYAAGLALCVFGYLIMNLVNRRYDLNKEIGDGNAAAGILVAGLFIGLSIIISGVIL